MIVCICEGLNDKEIRLQIDRGNRSVRELGDACGAGSDCGQCRRQLRGILQACGVETRNTRAMRSIAV